MCEHKRGCRCDGCEITVEVLLEQLKNLDPKARISRGESLWGSFTYRDPDGRSDLMCLCSIHKLGDKTICWCGCA
jgi:hypothetical protein